MHEWEERVGRWDGKGWKKVTEKAVSYLNPLLPRLLNKQMNDIHPGGRDNL